MILKDNRIHGPRHEKPQAIGTIGSGYQFVSVLLQQTQLSWIAVYTQQSAVGTHAERYIKTPNTILFKIAHMNRKCRSRPSTC